MKYPIGIQDFKEVRKGGFAYVDKTAILYRLADQGKYYFLSRPRRFGKSLFLSTLRYYFEGRRDLFEGLAVAELEKDWEEFPVLYLDLNVEKYDTPESLNQRLDKALCGWEATYKVCGVSRRSLASRFESVIRGAAQRTGRRVVILVDEYDKPLLQTIDNPGLQTDYRDTLKAFYGNLKSCDEFIRFAFLTGVTKFGKISIFSDLNNLQDISLKERYADICGMTSDEIAHYFGTEVAVLARKEDVTPATMMDRLRRMYDGYHFSEDTSVGVYNPFSVLNALNDGKLQSYWFRTGTPSILVQQLQKTDFPLERISKEDVDAETMGSLDVMNENPLPLMFQSGYLTIKSYNKEFDCYTLGFPNHEVEQGFAQFLTSYYLPKKGGLFSIRHFVQDVQAGNPEGFLRRLSALFSDGNYQVVGDEEIYFQNTLYVFFKLLGFYVDVERHTSDGRMDVLIQTPDYIYILELKVNQTAAVALRQIEEKGYAALRR